MSDEHKIMAEMVQDLPGLYKRVEVGRVLVAAALLDDMLYMGIQHHMVPLTKVVEKRIFAGTGPLSNLSSKIDLSYALGIIDSETHKQLHIVRDIRNSFAHSKSQTYFDNEIIIAKASSLPKRDKENDPEHKYMDAISRAFILVRDHNNNLRKPKSPSSSPDKSELESLRLSRRRGRIRKGRATRPQS